MINALLTSALFFRTTRHPTSVQEAELYLGEILSDAAEAMTVRLMRCFEYKSTLANATYILMLRRRNLLQSQLGEWYQAAPHLFVCSLLFINNRSLEHAIRIDVIVQMHSPSHFTTFVL
jgi:hypothetical protein